MMQYRQIFFAVIGVMLIGFTTACAEEPQAAPKDLHLSKEVRSLLQAEMREIADAIQTVAVSLATADWKTIESTGENIHASYVMAKNLSDSQKHELKTQLPDYFKKLDAEFHARAKKLSVAAAAHDSETVTFQYYKLVESCATCHATFAKSRFPGFSPITPEKHQH